MKKSPLRLLLICLFTLVSLTCSKDEPFKICANRCTSAEPWRVETLDLGLPCFATKQACEEWASAHFYNKPCVECN